MATVKEVSAWLHCIPGRKKAVILVSDGIEYDPRKIVLEARPSGRNWPHEREHLRGRYAWPWRGTDNR